MTIQETKLEGELAAEAATQATRVAYDQAYFSALLAAGNGSLDRARSGAELVQKSAAAIGTLYAGILGVTFSVSGRQLPIRGVVPAIFLGLAIVLSMVYVAYVTRPDNVALNDQIPNSPPERMQTRLDNFLRMVTDVVERRAYWLRASIIALGLGVLFLPAPFTAFTPASQPDLGQYPWPTPQAVANAQEATLDSIVLKAQADEVAAARQRATVGQSATVDLGRWVGLTTVGLLLVFLMPWITTAGLLLGIWMPWIPRRFARLRHFVNAGPPKPEHPSLPTIER